MLSFVTRNWLKSFAGAITGRRRRTTSGLPRRISRPPQVEMLEDRVVPAVVINQNFTGSSINDSGFIPPDTHGSVGPDHFVELLNGRYSVYDKDTGAQVQTSTLDTFWFNAGVAFVNFTFDPRVLYDLDSGRWFAVAVDNGGDNNSFLLAVSNSSDPTQGWRGFAIDSDSSDTRWADFPTLGLDADGVYVAGNMFPISSGGSDITILTVPKADLLLATPTVANRTLLENIGVSRGFTQHPVIDFGPSDGRAAVLSDFSGTSRSRTSILGADLPGATLSVTVSIAGSPTVAQAPNAFQPDGTSDLNTGDLRFSGAPFEVGDSIWAVHSVAVNGRAGIRWYEIDETTDTVLQTGTIASPNFDYYYPSVAANSFGEVVIGFTRSGANPITGFASSYAVTGQTTNGVTTFTAPMLLKRGVANYALFDGIGRNRWGDYSHTSVDPDNPHVFWTIQEWVSASNEWSTQITALEFVPDDLIVTADDAGGNGSNNALADTFRLVRNGADLDVFIDGNLSRSLRYDFLNTITVNGSSDDDFLTVDHSGGVIDKPFTFNADLQQTSTGDQMTLRGGTFDTITYTAEFDDSVELDADGPGPMPAVSLRYTNLEGVRTLSTTANAIYNLSDLSDLAFLEDNGDDTDGESRLRTTSLSFTFTAPTTSLMVNGRDDADTLRLRKTDPALTAPLTFNGDAGNDTLQLDFTNGDVFPVGGLAFDAGPGGGTVRLDNAVSAGFRAGTLTHTFTSTTAGSIDIGGGTISYSGITVGSVVFDDVPADNRIFNFNATSAQQITLGEDSAANGLSRVSSNSSPTVTFRNPSLSATVNAGTAADVITAGPLDSASPPAAINLNGNNGLDTFNVTPSATTTFTVDGDNPVPPTATGDTLNVDLTGVINPTFAAVSTANGFQGAYTFDNRAPVNFQEVEQLRPPVDLSVTLVDNAAGVLQGDPLTYTIVATNNGPLGLSGIRVFDDFTDTQFSSVDWTAVATPGSSAPNASGTGDIDELVDLAAGGSVTFTVTAVVLTTATSPLTNSVTVTPSTAVTDPNLNNNTATDVNAVIAVTDVGVTMTGPANPVTAGTLVSYDFTVTNHGPSTASNVQLIDVIAPDATFVSLTSPSGWFSATPAVGTTGALTSTIPTLAAGASASFSLVVRVNPHASNGSPLVNTVGVVSSTTDLNPANKQATVTNTVITSADLELTKTASAGPHQPGDNIAYTITLNNRGPSDATNVTVTDVVPANTTFVSLVSPAGWTATTPAAGGTGTITLSRSTLASGASATFTLVVRVAPAASSGTAIANTATAIASTVDPDPGDNTATVVMTINTQADLVVTQTDAPDPANAGGNLVYTLTVTNQGPNTAENVMLSEAVPANTTFVSFAAPAGWTSSTPAPGTTGTVTSTLASLVSGASATFTLVVRVGPGTANGAVLNGTATVTSTNDPNIANNSTLTTTTVNRVADLSVTLSDSPNVVNDGNNLTYTINVTNNGPSNASNVTLTEAVPANTTFVSLTAPADWTVNTPAVGGIGPVTASIGSLAPGASASFTFVVNVNSGTPSATLITSMASVASSTSDPSLANNSALQVSSVNVPIDLSVDVTDAPDPVTAGELLTYVITVTNNTAANVPNVPLSDVLPAATTFVSFTAPAGWISTTPPVGSSGTVSSSTAVLAANDTATFTLVVRVRPDVPSGSTIGNTVSVPFLADSTPADNTDSTTTTVATRADLVVTNSDAPDPVTAGENLVYTITVANQGPSDARTVQLSEPLPTGTTFVSLVSPTGWTSTTPAIGSSGTIQSTLPVLAAGASATFTLTVRASASTAAGTVISGTATATTTTVETNPANNSAQANTDVVTRVDLAVTNTAAGEVFIGDNLVYTVQVINAGPSDARDVVVADSVPAGTSLVSFTAPAGWVAAAPPAGSSVARTIPVLAAGATATFTLTVNVQNTAGPLVSTATVSGPADSSSSNNTASATTAVRARPAYAVGAPEGSPPVARLIDARTGAEKFSVMAYAPSFLGGVRVATGDVNGDGTEDLITGSGPGATPHVKVFDGRTGGEIASFLAFGGFTGGVFVAGGDFDGDGQAEVVTGAGPGAGPHVRIWDIIGGQALQMAGPLGSFFAYGTTFAGGVTVAAGNFDGVGGDELITGSGVGAVPHVKVFRADGAELASFLAFSANFLGGIFVAAGDTDGDGRAEIIASVGRMSAAPLVTSDSLTSTLPHVKVFSGGTAAERASFLAFAPGFGGGVRVGAVDRDGDGRADIIVGAGPGAGPHVRILRGTDLRELDSFFAFAPTLLGGVFSG